jgi:hypothetical protein
MHDANELNQKLLERSLEEHAQARSSFSRDLKVAVVLLLIFQFFVFFRFANLSDRQFELRPRLKEAQEQHEAVVTIRQAVEKMDTALKTGTTELTRFIGNMPQRIRNELEHLSEDLEKFQTAPLPSPDDTSTMMRQQFPNAASNAVRPSVASESRFFAGMSYDESVELHAAKTNSPVFRERTVRIVETQIIQPAFAELNEHAEDLVGQPLASALAELRQQTAPRALLNSTGADADGWLENAEQVVTMAKGLRFSPPKEVDWWTSAVAKGNFADAARLDTVKIAQEAGSALSRPDLELKALAEKMESSISSLKLQDAELEAQLTKLKANAASLEGLIEGYAKPLAFVALEPRDLVVFYPVILAVIVSTFLVRQVLLRRRAAILAQAYRALGVSDEMLDVYFSELPASSNREVTGSPSVWARSRAFAGWIWVVPAGFAIASILWVLASKSLSGDAPRFLYSLSALVLAAACVFLLRSSHGRLQTG